MKIYPDTKIYIICPGKQHSGGPELCHQLCSQLISLGVDSKLIYIYTPASFKSDPVHDFYKKYHLPYAFNFEDEPKNILIMPEIFTGYFYAVDKIQCVIWWLSVDNYLKSIQEIFQYFYQNSLAAPLTKIFSFHKADNEIDHFAQSEYARQFVKLNGVPDEKIHMVEDYLRQDFLSRAAQVDLSMKKNIVAFNPKKGFEVTQQLIELAPDIDWRPIENMTPAQVQKLLAAAKIYIDFGNHPGRDRIPREAAISGCVVITGRRGAAANDIDINIPAEFKFDEKTTEPQGVIKKIREVFENFPAAYEKQAAYRARIFEDKNRFTEEIILAFEIKNLPPPSVAMIQGVGEKSFLLAKELFRNKNFRPSFIVDDVMASTKISDKLIFREQNRNYLRVGQNFIEIITREDAKFLYLEGRIKKFALIDPSDAEIYDLQRFYEPKAEDVLIYELDG